MKGLLPEKRFMLQVKKTKQCWLWAAATDRDGYGIFRGSIAGKTYTKAHRFSYSLHTGEIIPDGMIAMHSCDNPRCVNPDHLSLGTNMDNMRDKIAKGRMRVAEGENGGHAVLTEKQVKAIVLDPRPYAQIAADYGVKASTIGSIKQRKSWKSVDIKKIVKTQRTGMRGTRQWSTHLADQDIRNIRSSQLSGKELSKRYEVSSQTICDIRKRRSWAHLE